MKPSLACAMFALGVLFTADAVQADTLLIERVQREKTSAMPTRGMLMGAVEANYGAPLSKDAAVGGDSAVHPPITRWRYADFSVYFEHDHVISSVMHKSAPLEQGPKPPSQ